MTTPEEVRIRLAVELGRSKYYVEYRAALMIFEISLGRQLTKDEDSRLYSRIARNNKYKTRRHGLDLLTKVTEKPL